MSNKETQVVVAGTGATLNVELGFIPDAIEVLNATDRTSVIYSAFDTVNTSGVDVSALGAKTKAASAAAGLAVSDNDSAFRGFTIGASASVNTDTNVLVITAKLLDYVGGTE